MSGADGSNPTFTVTGPRSSFRARSASSIKSTTPRLSRERDAGSGLTAGRDYTFGPRELTEAEGCLCRTLKSMEQRIGAARFSFRWSCIEALVTVVHSRPPRKLRPPETHPMSLARRLVASLFLAGLAACLRGDTVTLPVAASVQGLAPFFSDVR